MSYITLRGAGIFEGLGDLSAKQTSALSRLVGNLLGANNVCTFPPVEARAKYKAAGYVINGNTDFPIMLDLLAAFYESNPSKVDTTSATAGIVGLYGASKGVTNIDAWTEAKTNPLIPSSATMSSYAVGGYCLRALIADTPAFQLQHVSGDAVVAPAVPDPNAPPGPNGTAPPGTPGGGVTPTSIISSLPGGKTGLIIGALLLVGGIGFVMSRKKGGGSGGEVRTNPRRRRRSNPRRRRAR